MLQVHRLGRKFLSKYSKRIFIYVQFTVLSVYNRIVRQTDRSVFFVFPFYVDFFLQIDQI